MESVKALLVAQLNIISLKARDYRVNLDLTLSREAYQYLYLAFITLSALFLRLYRIGE